MGGRGGNSHLQPALTYARLPIATLFRGGGTPAEKKQRRDTISSFIKNAKAGDVYSQGAGIGSTGGQFEIVSYRRSPNGLGIRAVNSNRRVVALTSSNAASFLTNGATLVRRKR